MSLHKKVLPKYSYDLLETIQSHSAFDQFYLAGGTALALHIGHRESIDLDFFSPHEFPNTKITQFPTVYEVTRLHDNSIELFAENTKVMFFRFAFPLVHDIQSIDGIRLAHPIDVGLMKLLALQGRTTRKDIIDLYFIDQQILKLEELLKLFEEHYPSESFNSYDSLKQLFNVEHLKGQPMPKLYENVGWEECQGVVTDKIIQHIHSIVT